MQWFEPIIIIVAILLVIIPIITYIVKKRNGTLKCECGHEQSKCTGSCEKCNMDKKKNNKLVYIVSIEGMKCGMCESHINDVIRRNFDVIKVKSSRRNKSTTIEANHLLNIHKLKEYILNEGYSVLSISLK